MKKFIVALLITALLAGNAAVVAGKPILDRSFKSFRIDLRVYSDAGLTKWTGVIVAKGSICQAMGHYSKSLLVRLSEYGEEGNQECFYGRYWGGYVDKIWLQDRLGTNELDVHYVKGSFGGSPTRTRKPQPGDVRKDPCNKNHVKATASVWLHRTYGLSKNYGKALKKGQKVKYLHMIGTDKRGVDFYKVKYEGKCLWVSSKYTKRVK